MNTRTVTVAELGLIAVTRMALGAGLGLLLGDRLASSQRRAAGWPLLALGVITTFPLVGQVMFRDRRPEAAARFAGGTDVAAPAP
jgi:presenilin-like A22 family membrane protease